MSCDLESSSWVCDYNCPEWRQLRQSAYEYVITYETSMTWLLDIRTLNDDPLGW